MLYSAQKIAGAGSTVTTTFTEAVPVGWPREYCISARDPQSPMLTKTRKRRATCNFCSAEVVIESFFNTRIAHLVLHTHYA